MPGGAAARGGPFTTPRTHVFAPRKFAARDLPGHLALKPRAEFDLRQRIHKRGGRPAPVAAARALADSAFSAEEAAEARAFAAQPASRAADSDDEAELREEYRRAKAAQEEQHRHQLQESYEALARTSRSSAATDGLLRRRWFEDTVFRDQAARARPARPAPSNDLLHSAAHRRFLHKFVLT